MKEMASSDAKIPATAKKVFEGVIFDIYQWQQQLFDGSTAIFEAARRKHAVSIIPVIDDKIVIIHEEQPTRPANVGFPGGHLEPGEEPLQAAIRELKEETGLVFRNLKLVMVEDIGSHKIDWNCYRFIATDLVSHGEPENDPGERITIEQVSFKIAKDLAKDNPYMCHNLMAMVESLEELLALPAITLP